LSVTFIAINALSNDIKTMIKYSKLTYTTADLPSHPQHDLVLKQTTGYSGMISFYIKGNSHKFLKALRVFTLAESLGGYESLAEVP